MAETQGQLSGDGLWQWGGKKWARVHEIEVACSRCGRVARMDTDKAVFKCSDGHRNELVRCDVCQGAYKHEAGVGACPHCGATAARMRVNAWDWADDQIARGLWPEHGLSAPDVDRRFLRGFMLAAGGGTRIPNNTACLIDFASDRMIVKGGGIDESVPYSDMGALQIGGSSSRSGAHVIGGGFGVAGAIEGMLAASVINSLSSKTTRTSLIRVAARSSEYVFVSQTMDTNTLSMLLTPVQLRIRQASPAPSPPTNSAHSVSDELAKLAQLRDSGVLSDTEFAMAKSRLLG